MDNDWVPNMTLQQRNVDVEPESSSEYIFVKSQSKAIKRRRIMSRLEDFLLSLSQKLSTAVESLKILHAPTLAAIHPIHTNGIIILP